MTFDPTDPSLRPPRSRPQLHRRDVLRGGLWLTAGMGAASLLAACGSDSNSVAATGDYPLARPDDPLKLEIFPDNQPIADGLEPETGGILRVLNYADYMAPGVKNDFAKKYDVEVQVTPYNNYDQMVTKLTEPGASFDMVFPGPSYLGQMVYNQLLQPFNKSYIPNFKNTWPEFQDPWYDLGAQYTAPYTIYTTGVGYRADRVTDPSEGYQMIWNPAYDGKVGVLDDAGEALAMSMLANDITTDINTGNPEYINAAKDKLNELIDLVSVKTGITEYETLPSGKFTVHQAWSGDMVGGALSYLPKGVSADVLGYWVPEDKSVQVIGNDCICVPKSAEKPVLGHLFINALLDNDIALKNFGWNGYQPPLTKLSGKYLVEQEYVPDNLLSAVVVPEDFASGLMFYEQDPQVQNMWLAAFQEFQTGGG